MRRAFRLCLTWPTAFGMWATLEAAYLLGVSYLPTFAPCTYVQARRVYTRARVLARPHNLLIPLERWGGGEQSVGMRGVALSHLEMRWGMWGCACGAVAGDCYIAGALRALCRRIAGALLGWQCSALAAMRIEGYKSAIFEEVR